MHRRSFGKPVDILVETPPRGNVNYQSDIIRQAHYISEDAKTFLILSETGHVLVYIRKDFHPEIRLTFSNETDH